MAVIRETRILRYIGASTDTKPTVSAGVPIPTGSTFKESDTKDEFIFTGSSWTKHVKKNRNKKPMRER